MSLESMQSWLKKVSAQITQSAKGRRQPPNLNNNEYYLKGMENNNKPEIQGGGPMKYGSAPAQFSVSRPDYGPKYGQEITPGGDFQNSKIKLPYGHYFQSKLFNDVIVSEVVSPDCFFIRNSETAKDLQYLEENMKEWYDAYWTENPNIDPKVIFKDCYYACYIDDTKTWHRCRVDGFAKNVNEPMKILVQLMDHGTITLVGQECLLPLRAVYGKLPVQAAQASLQTVDDSLPWKGAEVRQFRQDVEGKHFQAFITEHEWNSDRAFEHVIVVLLEKGENGEERPYSLGNRLSSSLPVSTSTTPDL